MTIYDELKARGLIAQVTDEEDIKELINNGKATFYIGFDCTADSLTAGHFMALTLMKRLQLAGNKPIALLGGGTTILTGAPVTAYWAKVLFGVLLREVFAVRPAPLFTSQRLSSPGCRTGTCSLHCM